MRVCIYGAGAIGGHLAIRLAEAGEQVSLIARGPHLAALRERGLTLETDGRRITHRLRATDDPAELGAQDLVISTVKANALDAIAPGLVPLLDGQTKVVFAINGIPFWYQDEMRGTGALVNSAIRQVVDRSRIIACVIHSANTVIAPGVVHNEMPSLNRFTLGALDEGEHQIVQALAQSLTSGGAEGVVSSDIRTDVWRKAQINTMLGAVACLTGATGRGIAANAELRPICLAIAAETEAVAAAWGITIKYEPARLRPENYSEHKSSLLQDLELGRPMEIDEISGAVQQAGQRKNVPTPVLDQGLALLRMRARLLGLYAG